jgi:hypothetical protein
MVNTFGLKNHLLLSVAEAEELIEIAEARNLKYLLIIHLFTMVQL